MLNYFPLAIGAKKRETEHAVVLDLIVPEELSATFEFKAGQHLNVRAAISDEDIRRSYSICTSPSEGILRIGIKHVPGGKFSTWAMETLEAGDVLDVMPPQGKFTRRKEDTGEAQYVFFAAGSGITPVIALIKDILETEPRSEVILFYGNRKTDSIMFREELEKLKNVYLSRFSLYHILSREKQNSELFNGRIDPARCELFAQRLFDVADVSRFFICGPEQMIHSVKGWLEARGVDPGRILFELFGTGQLPAGGRTSANGEDVPEGLATVTVRVDGNAIEFPLAYSGASILDAAMAAGADVPFSCKGGVCCTCKAMLMDGKASMDVVYGLEPDEIDDGFILTCQAHPRTETILVDYDV